MDFAKNLDKLLYALMLIVALTAREPICLAQQQVIPADKAQTLVIAVCINDHPGQCLIDLHGYYSHIDSTLAESLGIERFDDKKTEKTQFGTAESQRYGDVEITFFGKTTALPTISGLNLKRFEYDVGHQVDCILSHDVLENCIVDISEAALKSSLDLDNDYRRLDSAHYSWVADFGPQLAVSMPILGSRNFMVGTANNQYLTVSREIASQLIRSRRAFKSDRTPHSDASGAYESIDVIIIEKLSILDVDFHNVPASVGNFNSIGFPLLRQLNLALDFPHKQIWQKKSPSTGLTTFPVNASGMAVVFVSATQLKVIKIRPESPSTLAGVEAGDEIVELQGQRPADLSLFQVQELLAQDGKIIKVVLDRKGDRLEKNLHLKRPFLYPPVWETTDEDSGEFEKFLEQNRRKSAAKSK